MAGACRAFGRQESTAAEWRTSLCVEELIASIRTPAEVHDFRQGGCQTSTRRPKLRSMRDTLPDAELVRRDAVRRLDPRERLRQAFELSDTLRRLRNADRIKRPEESPSAESDRPDGLDHSR